MNSAPSIRILACVPLLGVFAGVGLSSAGLLPAMLGWVVVALGALFGIPVALYIIVARIRKGPSKLWPFAMVAMLPLVIATPMVIRDLSYPLINDVTTDTLNPPAFNAALMASANTGRDMSFPEHFGPIVRASYADVQPVLLQESTQTVFERVTQLAHQQPDWEIKHQDAIRQIIEGEASSPTLGFIDDFVIRVSEQDGQARVDMRSKSRDGLVDAGVNAKRIRSFLSQLHGR